MIRRLKHLDAAREETKVPRILTASNGKGSVRSQGVGGLGVMKKYERRRI